MIVAELKAGGGALGEGAKMLAHALTHGLERLEAIGASAGVEADALGRAMIDGDDCSVTVSAARVSSLQGRLAFASDDAGQVGAPHAIDPLGGDGAVVGARAPRPAHALMRQQAVLAHQPQDAAPAGADAGKAQLRPELAVALAMKGRGRQEPPDGWHQLFILHCTKWPGLPALERLRRVAMAVDGRSRHAPDPRYPLQAVDPIRGGRDLAAHRLDLRRAKGR